MDYKKNILSAKYHGSPADSLQHVILFFNGLKSNLNALAKVNLDYVLNNKLSNSFFAFPILDHSIDEARREGPGMDVVIHSLPFV